MTTDTHIGGHKAPMKKLPRTDSLKQLHRPLFSLSQQHNNEFKERMQMNTMLKLNTV